MDNKELAKEILIKMLDKNLLNFENVKTDQEVIEIIKKTYESLLKMDSNQD